MTSGRSAWRSLRKAAGLAHVRFHDGRHTAITTLAEKGLPDWVTQAQVGHVAPEMMKTYSHIRRQALNQASDALEPASAASAPPPESPTPSSQDADSRPERVWSHARTQNDRDRGRILDFRRKSGSSGWIRTSNPPVNRLTQVFGLAGFRAGSSDEILVLHGVRQKIGHQLATAVSGCLYTERAVLGRYKLMRGHMQTERRSCLNKSFGNA
jgi:hypothetical protein